MPLGLAPGSTPVNAKIGGKLKNSFVTVAPTKVDSAIFIYDGW
jgi:hypothetical protein